MDRHCNRLDADLVKFEEEQSVGDCRITTLPGLQPSSRSLKEGADIRERLSKRVERDRKDLKGDKKCNSKIQKYTHDILTLFFFIVIKSTFLTRSCLTIKLNITLFIREKNSKRC